jgi:hypothetical protein
VFSQTKLQPESIELKSHSVMVTVKFFHELQHRATRLFLDLRLGLSAHQSTPKRRRMSMRLQSKSAAATKPKIDDGSCTPRCSQVSPGKSLGDTLLSVGSMQFNGEVGGDSGYELEEVMLGGRLRHRHLDGHCGFQVYRVPTYLNLSFQVFLCDGWLITQFDRWKSSSWW